MFIIKVTFRFALDITVLYNAVHNSSLLKISNPILCELSNSQMLQCS